MVCQICDNMLGQEIRANYFDNFTDADSFLEIVQEMAPTFDETMVLCKFFNHWSNCRDLLFPILTEEGAIVLVFTLEDKKVLTLIVSISRSLLVIQCNET